MLNFVALAEEVLEHLRLGTEINAMAIPFLGILLRQVATDACGYKALQKSPPGLSKWLPGALPWHDRSPGRGSTPRSGPPSEDQGLAWHDISLGTWNDLNFKMAKARNARLRPARIYHFSLSGLA